MRTPRGVDGLLPVIQFAEPATADVVEMGTMRRHQ
jgi:hypothetical protein